VDSLRFDPALVERVIHRAVPATVLGHQGQINQRPDRTISAQHRIGQLEQYVRPQDQRRVELQPEPVKITPSGVGCGVGVAVARIQVCATLTTAATAFVFDIL
jgi:hypothetical protein